MLNYGMPDLAGTTASSVDVRALERLLVERHLRTSSRGCSRARSRSAGRRREKMNHNAMCFDIEAELWAQPLPLRLFLRTEIDLENGGVDGVGRRRRSARLMDPRLLRTTAASCSTSARWAREFAREFPKIAGRLGLETFECADPYVERLLEGFAFLAARVHLKIDAEFPRFTQHLLEIVYPHYLAPTPSMAVVQMQPNLTEGVAGAGLPGAARDGAAQRARARRADRRASTGPRTT